MDNGHRLRPYKKPLSKEAFIYDIVVCWCTKDFEITISIYEESIYIYIYNKKEKEKEKGEKKKWTVKILLGHSPKTREKNEKWTVKILLGRNP